MVLGPAVGGARLARHSRRARRRARIQVARRPRRLGELEPADVRRGVAVIFQDFVRCQLTAQENIGLGEPEHVDDEHAVRSAAQRTGAATLLEELPNGYATILSKEFAGGRDLSLGQWQRVALARTLRRDAPFMILDEPSSALDPRSERVLFADVRRTGPVAVGA